MKDTQKSILRYQRQIRATGREAQLVDAAVVGAEYPLVERITRRLRLAGEYRVAVTHLEWLIAGRCGRTGQLLVV